MLRSLLVYLSEAGGARELVTRFGPAKRAARRFVAGETVETYLRILGRIAATISVKLTALGLSLRE